MGGVHGAGGAVRTGVATAVIGAVVVETPVNGAIGVLKLETVGGLPTTAGRGSPKAAKHRPHQRASGGDEPPQDGQERTSSYRTASYAP
jgi:hypothetical protein